MPRTTPQEIRARLAGRLVGISDRALAIQLDLYGRAMAEAAAIDRQYRRLDWTRPTAAAPSAEVQALYDTPIANLALDFEDRIKDEIADVRASLEERSISWPPAFYLGDGDFWTTDRAISINVPWFLANPALWEIVNEQTSRFSVEEIRQILRHETGHALGYAFELYRLDSWRGMFGDFERPYSDVFQADPTSRDFVAYLDRTGMKHYAQKHPDEDWAETFAAWLDGDWQVRYGNKPGALAKLRYVDGLAAAGAFGGEPKVVELGDRVPYPSLPGTVGEWVGLDEPAWSPHSALLRREPVPLNTTRLMGAYFGNLTPGGAAPAPGSPFMAAVEVAWGSWESYQLDLRAIAGSTDGWACTVWDAEAERLRNALVEPDGSGALADCPLLMVLACRPECWMPDYGAARHMGIAAVLRNLDWRVVEGRFAEADR